MQNISYLLLYYFDFQQVLVEYGPFLIAMSINWKFVEYGSGIFDDDSCSRVAPNHGMALVGYGTENGTDYWLIKNR